MLLFMLTAALAAPPEGPAEVLQFVEVVLGEAHACGRDATGQVACWGADATAVAPGAAPGPRPRPVAVPGLTDAIALSAGDQHTCAIRADRSVACWGDNQTGQLGAGHADPQAGFVLVPGLKAMSLALGNAHSCAVTLSGGLSCWGNNLYGQLGTDAVRTSSLPVPVVGVDQVVAAAAGYAHTCAATGAGAVLCWGDGTRGQLGRDLEGNTALQRPAPIDRPEAPVRGLAAREHRTCVLDAEGVSCWGAPDNLITPPDAGVPKPVLPRADLVTVSVGWGHLCGRTGGGRVICTGDDSNGQLGGFGANRPVVGAYGVETAASVAAGRGETCAARASGKVLCWGGYTPREKADARTHVLPPGPDKTKARERQLYPSTELILHAEDLLGRSESKVRVMLHTVDMQPCANTRLDVVAEVKRKRVLLELGDPFVPGGDCINTAGPAVALYDFPADTLGRRDLIVRWRKRSEDFYQLYINDRLVEILPLQETFTEWRGDKKVWRVPEGSLAVSCTDHLDQPVCLRRSRDGLPTCDALLNHPDVLSAQPLPDHAWGNEWFMTDPKARFVSPDTDHARYRALLEGPLADGSGCTEAVIRTWTGETWTNRPQ